jgi:hydroxymethylglutaryl-CoA lyase
MTFPNAVRVVEVGPRDGLQNEKAEISTAVKLALIERLVEAGCRTIEAGSFVSPRWVPQMADSAEILRGVPRRDGIDYPVLVPNMKGFETAVEAGAREVAVFASASQSFSRANINCTIEESLERFEPVTARARGHGIRVRGYVSCVLGCPYEGDVAPKAVADVSQRLAAMGCYEISLGDTIGAGTPRAAVAMVEAVARHVPTESLALHFHDTYGQALANIHACLQLGVAVVDSAVGGLGGCPYAKGATGNVATEDLVYMLDGMGIDTGIDLEAIMQAALFISEAIGRPPQSHLGRLAALRG